MNTCRFAHIALNCRDMAVTERFYTRFFGFERARVIDLGEDQIVFLKSGEMYLELFNAKGTSPSPVPMKDGDTWAGIRHLAFQVDDIDSAIVELDGHAPITFGPFCFESFIPGWRTVWVRDPDGNIVEISQGFVDQVNPPALEELVEAGAI